MWERVRGCRRRVALVRRHDNIIPGSSVKAAKQFHEQVIQHSHKLPPALTSTLNTYCKAPAQACYSDHPHVWQQAKLKGGVC